MAIDKERVEKARNMRKEGRLLREIAKAINVSVATAAIYCQGVLSKGKPPVNPLKEKYAPRIIEMYRSGIPIPEIAKILGIPAPTLFDWRRELIPEKNQRKLYVTENLRNRISKKMSRDADGSLSKKAVHYYLEEELSTPEIAALLGVSSVTVGEWLSRSGVERRKNPTIRTRKKLSESNLGEKRYNWKGGVTPRNMKIRTSLLMRISREECFKRDDFTCRICGQRGGKLNAHHIWPFQRFPDLIYEISNLLTLCKSCHDNFHKKAGGHVKVAIGPFFFSEENHQIEINTQIKEKA